jgi:bacterioferritin-associated ferredoxin
MYICLCKGITDSQVQAAISNGADYKTLRAEQGVATDCGKCGNFCKDMVKSNQGVQYFSASRS